MVTIVETMTYYAFLATILSAAAYALRLWLKRPWLAKVGLGFNVLALAAILVAIVQYTRRIGRIPLSSVFEYLLVFSCALLIAVLILAVKPKAYGPAAIVLAIAAALIGFSFGKSDVGGPLLPALQSNWRISHVMTAIIAYSCFALAFGIAVYYLAVIPRKVAVADLPAAKKGQAAKLERLMFNSVAIGFIFLTLLLITGAVWAEEAWGAWWSWDPKETWALITWIIYSIYLHLRLKPAWRGRRGCYLAIVGFVAVLFTLLGVSYLFGGLHSYG